MTWFIEEAHNNVVTPHLFGFTSESFSMPVSFLLSGNVSSALVFRSVDAQRFYLHTVSAPFTSATVGL